MKKSPRADDRAVLATLERGMSESPVTLADDPSLAEALTSLDRGVVDEYETVDAGILASLERLDRALDGLTVLADALVRSAAWINLNWRVVDEDGSRRSAADERAFFARLEHLDRAPRTSLPLADEAAFGAALNDVDQWVANDNGAPPDPGWAAADDPGFFEKLDLPNNTAPALADDPKLGADLSKLDDD